MNQSGLTAIRHLFLDDDPQTLALLKEQLVIQGDSVVPDLKVLANADSAIVATHAMDVLHSIAAKQASGQLEILFSGDGEIPIEQSSLLIATALMPWLNPEESTAKLDEWGAELGNLSGPGAGDTVPLLTGYLHGKLGFNGCTRDYYHHENSILPCVMIHRKGLPLTLTLIYMFVAARAGIDVQGVNLPGHFIARCGEIFFDPFHGGKILSRNDCAEILSRQQISLRDEHLESPGSREIVARMLANLRHAYEIQEVGPQKHTVDRWLGIVTGTGQ